MPVELAVAIRTEASVSEGAEVVPTHQSIRRRARRARSSTRGHQRADRVHFRSTHTRLPSVSTIANRDDDRTHVRMADRGGHHRFKGDLWRVPPTRSVCRTAIGNEGQI
jgi:hypothetical protein